MQLPQQPASGAQGLREQILARLPAAEQKRFTKLSKEEQNQFLAQKHTQLVQQRQMQLAAAAGKAGVQVQAPPATSRFVAGRSMQAPGLGGVPGMGFAVAPGGLVGAPALKGAPLKGSAAPSTAAAAKGGLQPAASAFPGTGYAQPGGVLIGTAASSSSSSARNLRQQQPGEEPARKARRLSLEQRAAGISQDILSQPLPVPFPLQNPAGRSAAGRQPPSAQPHQPQYGKQPSMVSVTTLPPPTTAANGRKGVGSGILLNSVVQPSAHEHWERIMEDYVVFEAEKKRREQHYLQKPWPVQRPASTEPAAQLADDGETIPVASAYAVGLFDISNLTDAVKKLSFGIFPAESFADDAAMEVIVYLAGAVRKLFGDMRTCALHAKRKKIDVEDFDCALRCFHDMSPPLRKSTFGQVPLLLSMDRGGIFGKARKSFPQVSPVRQPVAMRDRSAVVADAVQFLIQEVQQCTANDPDRLPALLNSAEPVFRRPEFAQFVGFFFRTVIMTHLCQRKESPTSTRWCFALLLGKLLRCFSAALHDEAVSTIFDFLDRALDERTRSVGNNRTEPGATTMLCSEGQLQGVFWALLMCDAPVHELGGIAGVNLEGTTHLLRIQRTKLDVLDAVL